MVTVIVLRAQWYDLRLRQTWTRVRLSQSQLLTGANGQEDDSDAAQASPFIRAVCSSIGDPAVTAGVTGGRCSSQPEGSTDSDRDSELSSYQASPTGTGQVEASAKQVSSLRPSCHGLGQRARLLGDSQPEQLHINSEPDSESLSFCAGPGRRTQHSESHIMFCCPARGQARKL